MKGVFFVLSVLCFCQFSSGQDRMFRLGMLINVPQQTSNFTKLENTSMKPQFGGGLFAVVNRGGNKSKVSSFTYGLEFSSYRYFMPFYNTNLFFTSSTVKVPVLYTFKNRISKKYNLELSLGLKAQIQGGHITTLTMDNNAVIYTREVTIGIFPLLCIESGLSYVLRNKKSINFCFSYNGGFLTTEVHSFIIDEQTLKSDVKGSYFSIKVGYDLFAY